MPIGPIGRWNFLDHLDDCPVRLPDLLPVVHALQTRLSYRCSICGEDYSQLFPMADIGAHLDVFYHEICPHTFEGRRIQAEHDKREAWEGLKRELAGLWPFMLKRNQKHCTCWEC